MSINKFFSLFLWLLSFVLATNLFKDIWRLKKAETRIVETRERLERAEKRNEELRQKKEYYQSDDFLEKQIRDKLDMAKPGETIVILPEELKDKRINFGQTASAVKEEKKKELANWQKWLELFK